MFICFTILDNNWIPSWFSAFYLPLLTSAEYCLQIFVAREQSVWAIVSQFAAISLKPNLDWTKHFSELIRLTLKTAEY